MSVATGGLLHAICECCQRTFATLVPVFFPDGAVFVVCSGCQPSVPPA